MNDYSQAKIYKIVGNGKTYIGSTIQRLNERFRCHKNLLKKWNEGTSKNYTSSFECLTDPSCVIELIEFFSCSCKKELLRREGEIIRNTDCVNKNIAGRTREEYSKDNASKKTKKEKRKINKEKISEYMKQYYQNNKKNIIEQTKQYRENNKEKLSEYQKKYRENNKEKISDRLECNKEKRSEYMKQYYQNNKDKFLKYHEQKKIFS